MIYKLFDQFTASEDTIEERGAEFIHDHLGIIIQKYLSAIGVDS